MEKNIGNNSNFEKRTENIENVDFVNLISTEEFLKILNFTKYNLDNSIDYYNKDNENENYITKEDLKNKKVLEILNILNPDKKNESINEILNIFKSPQFNNIYKQLLDYNVKNIFSETYKIYKLYFLERYSKDLNIDENIGKLTKRETLLDPNFKKFLENIEKNFGEKVNEDIYYFIKIYHGLENNLNISDEKNIQKIKDFLLEGGKYSDSSDTLVDKISFAIDSIFLKDDKEDLRKLGLSHSIKKDLEEFGILTDKNINLTSFFENFLQDLKKTLEESKKYKGFFQKVGFSFKLDFDNFSAIIGSFNKKILDNSTIYRTIKFHKYEDVNSNKFLVGNTLNTLFEKIGNDTKDFLNDEKNKDLNFIEKEFEKFVKNFSIKDVKSIDKFIIIWDNFFKYLNLDEAGKQKFLENKNILNQIPLVSGKNRFLANNLGNLSDYKGSSEIKKFLENIQKNYKDIKIDYIPNQREFSKSTEIFEIYTSLKENWKLTNINLSDLFLGIRLKEFLLNKENALRFLELKKLYDIKINSLEKLLGYELGFDIGNNANFNDDNIFFYITEVLSDSRFNYLKTKKDIILSRINLDDKNISLYDLYKNSNYLDENIAFNKNEKRISDLEKKFQNLGFSKEEILNIFAFNEQGVGSKDGLFGNDLLYYYVKNYEKDKTLDKILELFVEVRDGFLDKNLKQDNSDLLRSIINIYDKKSNLYKKGPEEFKKVLEILKKYNLKEKSFDSILIFLRNLGYNSNLEKYLNNENFIKFNKKISEKYYSGENKIFTLVYNVEIFRYLETKPELKNEIENGNFSKIEKVMDFLKNKFGINNKNHPSVLNYSFRYAENFEKTFEIYEKMKRLGEKVSINDMMIFSIISKEIKADPLKEKFFFDKNKLIDYIEKNIYNREKYERPKVEVIETLKSKIGIDKSNQFSTFSLENQLKNLQENYTERPDLKKMTLKELQHIYINSKILENIDKEKLEKILDTDVIDHSTEAGGFIYAEFDDKIKTYKTDFFLDPSISLEDGGYGQINSKIMPGLHFHLHALGYENKFYAGASGYGVLKGGDLPFTYYNDSINILFTPVYKNAKGKKIGVDLYWLNRDFDKNNPDYSHFKQVDLGTITLNNFK